MSELNRNNSVENPLHEREVKFGDIFSVNEHPATPTIKGTYMIIDTFSGDGWVEVMKYIQKDEVSLLGGGGGLPIELVNWNDYRGRLTYDQVIEALINTHTRRHPATEEDMDFYKKQFKDAYNSVSGIIKY